MGAFPGGAVVKTSTSSGRGARSLSCREARIPHAFRPPTKTQNRSDIVTSSIKTLKNKVILEAWSELVC